MNLTFPRGMTAEEGGKTEALAAYLQYVTEQTDFTLRRLTARVSQLERRTEGAEETGVTLTERAAALEGGLAGLEGSLSGLDKGLADLEKRVSALEKRLTALEN